MKRLLFLLCILCNIGTSYPRKYEFAQLSEKDGLSSNIATCVYQDHFGLIWIGTSNGLNLYTGENIYHYRHDISDTNSISDNYIVYISEDADGTPWISTYNGLNKYVREDDHFARFFYDLDDSSTISHNVVKYHLADSHGNFWVTTRKGLNKPKLPSISWISAVG